MTESATTQPAVARASESAQVAVAPSLSSSSLDTLTELRRLEEEMRTMAMVAGQASVEGPYTDRSAADAMFASYCSAWANRLATVLARVPAQPESEQ